MADKLYHGAAWYPELWDERTLLQDAEEMKKAGINVVRLGEFAWSKMEPEEGRIELGFFARIIGLLNDNGIETVMCTPTATPPIWFSHGHPERMHVNEKLERMQHGSRQHACTNQAYYRSRAAAIAERLSRELGRLPGLVAWQLDNEFKAHVAECFCPECLSLWREWLRSRYGTIDKLNEAWGTDIWSERYAGFGQVPSPGPAPFLHNSSLRTMYRLFSMEKLAEFADEQATILRKHSDAPITHNGSVAFHADNERLFRGLDFASFDTYATCDNATAYLFNNDLWRNFKRGKGYWIMETSPSYAGSLTSWAKPHPNGYLKAEAAAAYALGAEAFCYWLWRQQRAGCEQPHGSVLSAWGKPTVGYANVLEVEEARKRLEPALADTRPAQAEVALVYSDRAKAFLLTEPHRRMNHRGLMTGFYERLLAAGLHRDVVPEGAELDGYKLLFTPFLPYLSPELTERAKAFMRDGGVWIAGPLTGTRTEEHTLHTDAALGELEKLAGAEAVYSYPMDESASRGRAFGLSAPLSMWSEVFEPKDATAVGIVEEGLTPGFAFATEKRIGKGKLVLLGSMPAGEEGERLLEKLMLHYADEAHVSVRSDVSGGTIVAPRRGDGYDLWVVVNMDGSGGSVTLPRPGWDPSTGEALPPGELRVGRYEFKIVRFNREEGGR
ncbi:beta-galactosidase [Cohnella thailandensis]|uniref:Beta-galactosidase n=1 Tax=Cohnella thailandensis TaxID=557557 RepID=A0A841SPU9_9BACL|nr:beta-galactosidase [Cohnella thailandensis]MBP1972669.1 beta-galactosidase [Cohnella thailandensis]